MSRFSLRRLFLFSTLGSLGLAGLLGVAVLLLEVRLGDQAFRVIVTAVLIAALSLAAMAYAWVWERGRRRPIVLAGAILAGLLFLLSMYVTWADPPWPEVEVEAKALAMGSIWTACLLLLAVLALARLRRPWNIVNGATQMMLVLLATMATLAIGYEIDDEIFFRTIGILVVLSACGGISVPILQRLSSLRPNEAVTTALVLQIVCPRCGKPQNLPAGHSRCPACRLRLYIEIEEERCSKCGYVLYRLTSDRCPECGTPVAVDPAPAISTAENQPARAAEP